MKNIWPIGLTIFFVFFVGTVVTFTVWTFSHRQDLVAPDYYEQTVHYQDRIDAMARVAQEGLEPLVAYDTASSAVSIGFSNPSAVQSSTGTVTFYRPSQANLDRVVAFAPDSAGRQLIAGALISGLWRIRTEWFTDGRAYFAEKAVMVP